MKEAPHHSGEQPQRPRTHSCGNTGLPGGFPAPQGRGGMRLRSPAARGPGGETPPGYSPRRDRRHTRTPSATSIRSPRSPRRDPASQTRRRFRQAPGPAPAGPSGDMDRQVNRPIFTWPAGPPRPGPGPGPVRDLTRCQHPQACTLVPKQAASCTAGRDFLRHPHCKPPGPSLPSGPGETSPPGPAKERAASYADKQRQRPPSARGFRKETGTRHGKVPGRHGDLRLRGQAVGGPGRRPRDPVAVHQPGNQAWRNEGARATLRTPPKSALDGLITCGSCGKPMLRDDTRGSRKPATRARAGVPRRGCTPSE